MNSSRTTWVSRIAKPWQTKNPAPSRYNRNARLHVQLKDCFTSLLRTPPKAAFFICALILTLPATFAIWSGSFASAEKNLLQSRHITVFLNPRVSNTDAKLLATNLATNKRIIAAVVAPLTIQGTEISTLNIQPSTNLSNEDLSVITRELNSHSSVDFVDADATWLQSNVHAIETTKKLAIAGSILASLVAALLVFGITRADLMRHQAEYRVLNQMGASHSTVLRPVLLRSLLLTSFALCLASLLAWGTVETAAHLVDISSYKRLIPNSLPVIQLLSLILVAFISSVLTVNLLGKKLLNLYLSAT